MGHEESGLERVFMEHHDRIFRAAYRVTGNAFDAEDVLQTVFLRLARREDAPAADNLASYLYRAAVNTALDVLRSRKGKTASVPLDSAPAPVDASPSPEDEAERGQLRAWLRGALTELSPEAALMFTLRYVEGHGNTDIARMLSVSRIRVAVSLHRTRKRLRDEFRATRGVR